MRIVAKFGGTSLKNGERIDRASAAVKEAIKNGHEVVVVASAMGNTTDKLLDNINFELDRDDRDEIVSMGERTSVRMLKACLESKNVDASFVEPGMDKWPIISEEGSLIDEEATKSNLDNFEALLSSDHVYIFTGYLAEDLEGNITTLGRGGSDTTATILGYYLDADRVTIVTDVEGVLTGNPEVVEAAHNVGEISIEVLRELSFKGAEVLAPAALKYKSSDMDVEVVHYQSQNLLESGTSIEGEFERIIDCRNKPLSSLTVAGREIRNQPGILGKISNTLGVKDINIFAIGTGADSITMYVDKEKGVEAQKFLHEIVVESGSLSSVTLDEELAAVRVIRGEYMDQPGVIKEISEPIAEANINIHEMITSSASINVFVNWEDREETLNLVQSIYEEN